MLSAPPPPPSAFPGGGRESAARLRANLRAFAAQSEEATLVMRDLRARCRDRVAARTGRNHAHLTTRELHILRLIGDGMDNVEIARELHFALGTIKLHVREILEQLGVHTRAAAAVAGVRQGLI